MACRSTSDLDTFLVRASCSRTRVVSESSRTLVGKIHLLPVYYEVYYTVTREHPLAPRARPWSTPARGFRQQHRRLLVHRQAGLDPGVEAAQQRADPGEAILSELVGHPGRRGFVRSGAVEDELPPPRQLGQPLVDLVEGQPQRARDAPRVEPHPPLRA